MTRDPQAKDAWRALELEVFGTLFASVAEEMGVLLQRAAFSPNIKERRDYSCAVFSAAGELIAQAAHIPVHLGSAPLSVRAAMEDFDFSPGDAVLLNDPYRGGTHLPDLTLVHPVFLEGDRPSFYVATRAHHADVGGAHPGSMASCRDVYGEGLRIPPVRLLAGGEYQRDILSMVLANVRTPGEREADLRAQCAANDRGAERVRELADRYGEARLGQAAQDLLDAGERAMRGRLLRIPDGVYRFQDVLDDDGAGGGEMAIKLELTIEGDHAVVDFAGTCEQRPGSLNANPAVAMSAVLYVFQCLLGDERSPNEGMARPLEILLEKGSILDPREGAAVAGGNVETSQRLVDVLLGALSQALPEDIPAASQGTMNNLTVGSSEGLRPFSYYETLGGGAGAGPNLPGASGIQTHMTNTLNTPVEALETAYPLRVVETRLARASGGHGKHDGGAGIVRELELLAPARVAVLSDRRRSRPYGLCGGEAGAAGINWVVKSGQRMARPAKFVDDLVAGDRVGIQSPGGGGHGESVSRGEE